MAKDAKRKKTDNASFDGSEEATPKKSPGKVSRKKSPNFGASADFIQLQTTEEEPKTGDELSDNEEIVANEVVDTPSVKKRKRCSTENTKSAKKASADEVEKRETDKYKLFIGKLSSDTTQDELEEHFRKSVDFVSIQYTVFKSTKKSRGYAFIQLASKEDYKMAQTLNDSVLKGKQIVVERIQAKRKISDDDALKKISDVPNKKSKKSDSKENEPGKNKAANSEKKTKYSLFIGMLPFDTTKEELEAHVKKSNVNFASIRMPAYESTKKPRGFAFIDFSSEEDYKAALVLNKSVLKGRQISVEYTCAGSKKSKKRSARIKAKTLKFKGLQEIGIMPKRVDKKSKTHKNSKHTVVFKGKITPKN